MNSKLKLGFLAGLIWTVFAKPASAEPIEGYPSEVTRRPLTLPEGVFEIKANVGIDLGYQSALKKFTVSPGIEYGALDRLTVTFHHSESKADFFGGAFCFGDFCGKNYNGFQSDVRYAVVKNANLSIVPHVGFEVNSIVPFLSVGFTLGSRFMFYLNPNIALYIDPSFGLGLIGRGGLGFVGYSSWYADLPIPVSTYKGEEIPMQTDYFSVPAKMLFQVGTSLNFFVETGFYTSFQSVGRYTKLPLGAGGTVTLDQDIDIGLRFMFTHFVATDAWAYKRGIDARTLDIFANFRF